MVLVVSMFVTFSSIRNFIGFLPSHPLFLVTEIEYNRGCPQSRLFPNDPCPKDKSLKKPLKPTKGLFIKPGSRMNVFPPLSMLIDRLQANSWTAQLLPALGLASAVTGYGTSAFCSGSLSEGQNSSRVQSARLVPTQLPCAETPPAASAVSCGLSSQPQDSVLAPVNSFCICQRLRGSGQAGNLTCQVGAHSIASPILPSLSRRALNINSHEAPC